MSHIGCRIVEIGSWVGTAWELRDCSSVVDALDSREGENGLAVVGLLVARDSGTNLVVEQERHCLTDYVEQDSHPNVVHVTTSICWEQLFGFLVLVLESY